MKKNTRLNDSFTSLEVKHQDDAEIIFLKSSSDIGVRKNKGRAGSRYSPDTIINVFKKMSHHKLKKNLFQYEVSNQSLEKENFNQAQDSERDHILSHLDLKKNIIHLGGGHDHIFPLLMACEQKLQQNFYIINLDAHLDTRDEDERHSGTPFRDFDYWTKKEHKLLQYGIHNYANSDSTFKELKNIHQKFFQINDHNFYKELKSIPKESVVILSLDADAIDSSQMQAVSAVNHNGIHLNEIRKIIDTIKDHDIIFGIYEYNPIYDDLSQKGARNLAALVYNFIKYTQMI